MLNSRFSLYLQSHLTDETTVEIQRDYLLAVLMSVESNLSGMGIKADSVLAEVYDEVTAAIASIPNKVLDAVDIKYTGSPKENHEMNSFEATDEFMPF